MNGFAIQFLFVYLYMVQHHLNNTLWGIVLPAKNHGLIFDKPPIPHSPADTTT